jgi:hypothetical protein
MALYALQSDETSPSYDLSVWAEHRKNMFLKSKNENPYFFYPPFASAIASTGGFTFPPCMFANKSAEYSDNGILDKEILKSFFSIPGPNDNLVYTHGYEQIPANFYKRAIGNEDTAALFFEDSINFAKASLRCSTLETIPELSIHMLPWTLVILQAAFIILRTFLRETTSGVLCSRL